MEEDCNQRLERELVYTQQLGVILQINSYMYLENFMA